MFVERWGLLRRAGVMMLGVKKAVLAPAEILFLDYAVL